MMRKESIKISGMSCAACANRIEKGLNKLEGVNQANVNLAVEKATVDFDDRLTNPDKFEEIIKKLGYGVIKETPAGENQVELKITGMSCAACSAKIEKSLNKMDGVDQAAVNLTTERARVKYDVSRVKVSEMIRTIQALGYEAEKAEDISRDQEQEQRQKEIRQLRMTLIISAVLSAPLLLA
ncbi:MAG TPA: heavy metal translocating P-type ATPase, partial [Syntrophomonas sp.]|nr:heavy metal translocating P-type ATPase [Syntrophomonas sp.]